MTGQLIYLAAQEHAHDLRRGRTSGERQIRAPFARVRRHLADRA